MLRERDGARLGHEDGVLAADAEVLAIDSAVSDRQHHPGRHGVDPFLAMDDGVAARNGRLLVLDSHPVEDGTQEGVAEAYVRE
jgi:hypothetical protein